MAPLTILCGANSSGKSSLIQSILLIRQTFEFAPNERVLALNGPLVRLGTFTDLLNSSCNEPYAEVGWKLRSNEGRSLVGPTPPWAGDDHLQWVGNTFSFDAQDSSIDQASQELQPSLRQSSTTGEFRTPDDVIHPLKLSVVRTSGQGRKLQYQATTLPLDELPRIRVSEIDDETKAQTETPLRRGNIVSCTIDHFLPSSPIIRFDRNLVAATRLAGEMTGERPRGRARPIGIEMPQKVIKLLSTAIAQTFEDPSRTAELTTTLLGEELGRQPSADAFISRLWALPLSTRRALMGRVSKSAASIAKELFKTLGSHQTVGLARVARVAQVNRLTDTYFRFSVRYLGPLRADPSPLYPLQASVSPTDVGPKGELTAAVLHLNGKRLIDAIIPSNPEGEDAELEVVRMPLATAVTAWLSFLGVADDVVIEEKGKLGHELRVKPKGSSEFQDLTNVGVGVSQVLPIVVTCLLADVGSTIVLEQPELHLHPRVQSRLSDLFISMIRLGKQIVIETHSEHIIERVRLRVAEDLEDKVLRDTAIYFFAMSDGATEVTPVKLTKYGAISDWPKDFFDQSQVASEQIVLRALRRRRVEAELKAREQLPSTESHEG